MFAGDSESFHPFTRVGSREEHFVSFADSELGKPQANTE